jgi:hypothetical protein
VRSILAWPVMFGASFVSLHSHNALAAGTEIPSRLECSATSKHPERKSNQRYSLQVSFIFNNNSLQGEPATRRHPGKEVYSQSIGPNRVTKITGRGAYDNGVDDWHSDFSGPLGHGEPTVVRGSLETKRGEHRNCSITFLVSSDKLAAILEPLLVQQEEQARRQLSELAEDMEDKRNALHAAQEDLKKQQADVALKTLQAAGASSSNELKALQAAWDKLSLATADLNDRQKALDAVQQTLKEEQAKTSHHLTAVQTVLDGIVLPITEDRKSWTMRVETVPLQQQQFCRIVDEFHDDIEKVYKTHQNIDSLFRDRQNSMAALLPNGEFSNWVVQVKEVTRARDGRAAVMLQPPCRVMLGSDPCQSSLSKHQANMPTNSSGDGEFGLVYAGDFVVVSGKVMQGDASDNKPPTYAVYRPGTHCSSAQGSKQQDVFVTEISYLVQLR